MFTKVNSFPSSQELVQFGESVCPVDAHIHVTVHGVWADNAEGFGGRSMSSVTTACRVVRAWSCKGITYWTLENWEHDNGYRCNLTVLSKAEFLSLIRS